MPAAELQETGRIPPNAHHSMPEYGCRPCSGLDPPMIKKVGAPCRRHPERKWTRHAGDARKERSVGPAVRVRDGAPGCARSRWSPRLCVFTMDAARAETPVPSPRGKGAKGKSRAKASRRRAAAAKAAPKLKAVLSGFWAILHAGNSHFRANRGGAARCEQPGVRGVARGGARAQRPSARLELVVVHR